MKEWNRDESELVHKYLLILSPGFFKCDFMLSLVWLSFSLVWLSLSIVEWVWEYTILNRLCHDQGITANSWLSARITPDAVVVICVKGKSGFFRFSKTAIGFVNLKLHSKVVLKIVHTNYSSVYFKMYISY